MRYSRRSMLKSAFAIGAFALNAKPAKAWLHHGTPFSFVPAQNVFDTSGALVEAHSGGLIQVGSFIYWVGFPMTGITIGNFFPANGINLYRCTSNQSSVDYLYKWEFVAQILAAPIRTGVTPWGLCTRPHIVFNANNNTFCLAAHANSNGFTTGACVLASSSNIESGWSWVNQNFDPSGNGFADCYFYTNAANTLAYLVYAGTDSGTGVNKGIFITKMDSTFVTSAVSTNTVTASGMREAPILFDNGTNLFLITSEQDAWPAAGDADERYCTVAGLDPIAPTWPSLTSGGTVFPTSPPRNGFLPAQGTFVFKPVGKSQYIFGSDMWFVDGFNGTSSRQAWSPLTVGASVITATQPASWAISDLT